MATSSLRPSREAIGAGSGLLWTRSSAVEHRLHTAGVTGSIPVASTKKSFQIQTFTKLSSVAY